MNLSLFRKRKYAKVLWYISILLIINLGIFVLNEYNKSLPLVVKAALPETCKSTSPPKGALSGDPAPIWCYPVLSPAPSTLKHMQKSIRDEFNQSQLFAKISNDYKVIDTIDTTGHSTYWRHVGQLLVDSNSHTSAIRPGQTITPDDGKLTMEIDVVTNMPEYNENISHAISISASNTIADTPSGNELRCTISGATRTVECSLGNRSITSTNLTARQLQAWKSCEQNIPASECQNTFRFEVYASGIRVSVNKVPLIFNSALDIPKTFMSSAFSIYLLSQNQNPAGSPYRFYWDHLVINPISVSPAPSNVLSVTNTQATQEASIQFRGNGFGRVPHVRSFNAPDGWTIETWFKDESSNGFNHEPHYLLIKGDTQKTENIPYLLGIERNVLFIGTRYNSQNKIITYNLLEHEVNYQDWHHVAATLDPDKKEIVLYINGLAVAKSEIAAYIVKDNNQPLYIGKNGMKNHWIGTIDDVRIWNRPRTAVEIRNNYLRELQKPQEHLVGNWKFNESKGKMAFDFSPKQEHMTIVNGVWSIGMR